MASIGNYELLRALSTGGMGEVLLARRRGPGAFEQLVALKTVRTELARLPLARAHFLDEAAILARLQHPNIATVYDFGEQDGALYLAMEYVSGLAFRDVRAHGLPPEMAALAIAEAARGLHAAHQLCDVHGAPLGVVHRDISPDNLMLTFSGHVKVIDFGIALIRNRQAPVTEFGALKGKPPYMSPEQLRGEALDARSDVFSLAVVLWELLVGQPLFGGDSIYAVVRAVEQGDIVAPSRHVPSVPPVLDELVLTGLARDPTLRWQSAEAFANALAAATRAPGLSLAAWAQAALAVPRAAHQQWLTEAVAAVGEPGGDASAPARQGRGAEVATELNVPDVRNADVVAPDAGGQAVRNADDGRRATALAAPPPEASAGLVMAGIALDELDAITGPPRRRWRWPLAALATLGGVAGLGVLLRSVPVASGPATGPQRGLIRPAPMPPPPRLDARVALPDAVPVAANPRPTAVATVGKPPALRRSPKAEPSVPPPQPARARPVPVVAPVVAPVGEGKLTITADPFVAVTVDGVPWGPSPLFGRALAAGRHEIVLTAPDTGLVRLRKVVEVRDGDQIRLAP